MQNSTRAARRTKMLKSKPPIFVFAKTTAALFAHNALAVATETLPRTVLVVDDEAGVRELLTRLLEKKSIPVRAVATGEEALALLQKEQFGCLLTDKNLPGLSGVDLIRKARALQPFCACLLMTAYASMESVLEAMRLGAADYLEKPLPDLQLVVEKISRAMDVQKTAFERLRLSEALKAQQKTLAQKDELVFAQRTEREMLEMVLELKVEEATTPLLARGAELEQLLRQTEAQRRQIAAGLHALQKLLKDAEAAADEKSKALLAKASAQLDLVLGKLGTTVPET
jgi:FixJ family two-component response regulator